MIWLYSEGFGLPVLHLSFGRLWTSFIHRDLCKTQELVFPDKQPTFSKHNLGPPSASSKIMHLGLTKFHSREFCNLQELELWFSYNLYLIFVVVSTNKQGKQNSEYIRFGQRVNVLFFLNIKWRHNDSQLENISITNSTAIIDKQDAWLAPCAHNVVLLKSRQTVGSQNDVWLDMDTARKWHDLVSRSSLLPMIQAEERPWERGCWGHQQTHLTNTWSWPLNCFAFYGFHVLWVTSHHTNHYVAGAEHEVRVLHDVIHTDAAFFKQLFTFSTKPLDVA